MYSTHKINLFFAINFCPTTILRLILLCPQCCCLLQILQGPNLSVVSASSEGKIGKKEFKENIAVGGKGRGRWGKQQGSLHHTYTIVHKQYQPYTLRIIYLTYFFLRNPVS